MKIKRSLAALASALIGITALAGCSTQEGAESGKETGKESLSIVSTTGYLTDAIANIAPDVQVKTLVPPGGDPHTQELTTNDIEAVDAADLVVWTSHDMEHRMMDHFDKLGDRSLPAAEAIPESKLLPWEGEVEGHDPHVWNSPELWQLTVSNIADKLGKIDSANADMYKKNADEYNAKLKEADEWAKAEFEKLPADRRYVVTGHDAFNYLGKQYGLEVVATDFVSSEAEMSAAELDELATLVADHKIPVIFQDNLKNPEIIRHLEESVAAKGGSVTISDKELFADTLSDSAPTNTYLGAFKYNVSTIVEALS